ncbi:unnamed protein product [Trypanosoma congolense IL3000]|uniref:WGS project CAEQ00000000 data, annotated contig 2290 n=1 Tax=Trypanosoma congolense (strain IL3000) TaxID=1068625 RepID=F9WCY4_TRYCI|nr:unnamed protein product [Trypanosoma congolense IL3000]
MGSTLIDQRPMRWSGYRLLGNLFYAVMYLDTLDEFPKHRKVYHAFMTPYGGRAPPSGFERSPYVSAILLVPHFSMDMGHYVIVRVLIQVLTILLAVTHITESHGSLHYFRERCTLLNGEVWKWHKHFINIQTISRTAVERGRRSIGNIHISS